MIEGSQCKFCKIPTDPSHVDLFFFPKAKLVLSFAPALHSSVRPFRRTMRAFSLTRFQLFEHPHPSVRRSAVAKSEIGTPLSLVVRRLPLIQLKVNACGTEIFFGSAKKAVKY